MAQTARYFTTAALVGALVGLAVVAWTHRPKARDVGFADAVAIAEPSVVNISTKSVDTRTHAICDLPRYRELCDSMNSSNRHGLLGSGVIVRSDGYILTNAHVIADADKIYVSFFDNETTSAEVIGTDPETDLAVIRANATGLKPIKIGSSDDARVGDIVLAIGNPFGIGRTVSMGIISAKGRYGFSDSPYEDFLQTDAAINPGNSGGALIDVKGHLVGINSLFYSESGGSQGIGFAVPAKLALAVLDQIIAEGHVTRGWLGIEVDNDEDDAKSAGVVLDSVVPNSPAAKAGLMSGDVIVAVNDHTTAHPRDVTRQVASAGPGSDIKLALLRNGERLEVHATAGLRPPPNPH
ncbi:MAG TPA: trypsin-like peptidase domain-containing protein [Pseudomonadales bacterium]|nr:trypsin-like peptidase domain-containing protein [Pseudomonadales bacterium]